MNFPGPSKDGWTEAKPERIPRPSYWPAALALATTLILWGLLAGWPISAVGLVLFFISAWGWIGEFSDAS